MKYDDDKRIVMTLDAGGTNFVFSAIQGNKEVAGPLRLPSNAHDLEKCLDTIIEGFTQLQSKLEQKPAAISFAFPGPADYPNGIIGDLVNLPGFRGGVALGPMLESLFNVPVFINNDGDLFVYGEAIAGLLPQVNEKLKSAGSPKQYKNIFGVTLGTGFGGGMVSDGELFLGDNSAGFEIWSMRNKLHFDSFAEEGASIRGVKGTYAGIVGIDIKDAPEPCDIFDIAKGNMEGNKQAAVKAFDELAEIVGDVLANTSILIDGLIVIGGGLSGASELLLPGIVAELNSKMATYSGEWVNRMESRAFNLEDEKEMDSFAKGDVMEIMVPRTNDKMLYDPLKRVGVGISRLGTSKAVAIGAYAFALHELSK